MNKSAIFSLALIATLSACNHSNTETQEQSSSKPKTTIHMKDLKPLAEKAQNAFFKDYNPQELKNYFAPDYIQHNPYTPTGLEPILGFLPALEAAGTTHQTHRLLQDGDFIIAHNSYDNAEAFGAKEMVAFDIYRIQDGKVAEHWDAITPKVTETASGRSQTDGPTELKDAELTEANKALIQSFIADVLMGAAPEKITDYINAEYYHQHNPNIKDGLDGLNQAIEYLLAEDNMFKYERVHRILGEGNFVLSQSEGTWNGGKKYAFYDLFRIEDGKIVEHWDVIQEVPVEQAHSNGMF